MSVGDRCHFKALFLTSKKATSPDFEVRIRFILAYVTVTNRTVLV